MRCPACGSPDFYEGLATLNCVRPGCVHYVPPATYRDGAVEPPMAATRPTDGYLDAWVDTGVRADNGRPVILRRGVYVTYGSLPMWSRHVLVCLGIRSGGAVDPSAWHRPMPRDLNWSDIVDVLGIPDGFNVAAMSSWAWVYERAGVELYDGCEFWTCRQRGGSEVLLPRSGYTAKEAWGIFTGKPFPD